MKIPLAVKLTLLAAAVAGGFLYLHLERRAAYDRGYTAYESKHERALLDAQLESLAAQAALDKSQKDMEIIRGQYEKELAVQRGLTQSATDRLLHQITANSDLKARAESADSLGIQIRNQTNVLNACVRSVNQLDGLLAEYQSGMREATDYFRLKDLP